METIVHSHAFEDLDPAVRCFIDAAWEPPLTEFSRAGLRRRRPDFPDKREIMTAAAAAMDRAFRDRSNEEIVYDPNPAVDAFDRWRDQEDATLRAYRLLMEAWNARRDLGTCRACGNLLLPGKGRIARYCSDACRMRMYRGVEDVQRDMALLEKEFGLEKEFEELRDRNSRRSSPQESE